MSSCACAWTNGWGLTERGAPTSEAKGFAFVEFKNERDADDARHNLDGVRIDGREVRVVFAQERRKTTDQMRDRERCVLVAGCFLTFFPSPGTRVHP
jgi:RNA recognition motif-containing protein